MTITELIAKAQAVLAKEGDLPLYCEDYFYERTLSLNVITLNSGDYPDGLPTGESNGKKVALL